MDALPKMDQSALYSAIASVCPQVLGEILEANKSMQAGSSSSGQFDVADSLFLSETNSKSSTDVDSLFISETNSTSPDTKTQLEASVGASANCNAQGASILADSDDDDETGVNVLAEFGLERSALGSRYIRSQKCQKIAKKRQSGAGIRRCNGRKVACNNLKAIKEFVASTSSDPLKCPTCGETFGSPSDFNSHLNKHFTQQKSRAKTSSVIRAVVLLLNQIQNQLSLPDHWLLEQVDAMYDLASTLQTDEVAINKRAREFDY